MRKTVRKSKKKMVTKKIYIDEEMYDKVKEDAEEQGVFASTIIYWAINKYIDNYTKGNSHGKKRMVRA